jgi:hypothetical protein
MNRARLTSPTGRTEKWQTRRRQWSWDGVESVDGEGLGWIGSGSAREFESRRCLLERMGKSGKLREDGEGGSGFKGGPMTWRTRSKTRRQVEQLRGGRVGEVERERRRC